AIPFDADYITLSNTGLDLSQIPIFEPDTNGNGTFDSAEDLNGNGVRDVIRSRCILFGADGRSSLTRNITSIVGQTIGLETPRPGNFEIGMIKIETQDIRYSYMLTVRNTGGPSLTPPDRAQVDVVVFFNRGGSDSNLHETTVWALANPAESN